MAPYQPSRSWLAILVTCSVLWCGGCSDLANVTGKVTLDGAPLPNALVTFTPAEGRASTGQTDQDGKYELSYTFDRLGAEVGSHTVRITSAASAESEAGPVETLPARYNADTELKAELKSGLNEVDFDLESGGPVAPRTPARANPTQGSNA